MLTINHPTLRGVPQAPFRELRYDMGWSHGSWLGAATWVLARERSIDAIRDALVSGRTCVRGPEACTFEARGDAGEWVDRARELVGADLRRLRLGALTRARQPV